MQSSPVLPASMFSLVVTAPVQAIKQLLSVGHCASLYHLVAITGIPIFMRQFHRMQVFFMAHHESMYTWMLHLPAVHAGTQMFTPAVVKRCNEKDTNL